MMPIRKILTILIILGLALTLSTVYGCVIYKNFIVCGIGNNTFKYEIAREAYKIYEFYTKKLHLKILPPCEKHYYITLTVSDRYAGYIQFGDRCVNTIDLVPYGRYPILHSILLSEFKSTIFVLAHELAHAVNHYYNQYVKKVIDESFADALADFYFGYTIEKIIENRTLYFDGSIIDFYCMGKSSLENVYGLGYYEFDLEALYVINTSIETYIKIVKENNVTLWWYSALPLLAMFVNGSKTITKIINNDAKNMYGIRCGYYVTHNTTFTITTNCLECARFITAPSGYRIEVRILRLNGGRLKVYDYGSTIILIFRPIAFYERVKLKVELVKKNNNNNKIRTKMVEEFKKAEKIINILLEILYILFN